MKNVKDIRWKSEVKQTPFAPEWDYTFIEGEIDDVDFDYISNYLLENKYIATVPGSSFGDNGEGFLRISYASNLQNLKKSVICIKEFINE